MLLAPVLFLLAGLAFPLSPEAAETWVDVKEFLLKGALKDTLILIIGTCVCSIILALPAAWVIEHFTFPCRRLIAVLLILPLAFPPYIAAYLSTDFREALIPLLIKIRETRGIDAYLFCEELLRYGLLIVLFSSVLFPYVFLAARAAFSGAGKRLAEAGAMLGRSPWKVFWSVQLPLARPALIAGVFLIAMEVLNDYAAAKHFGFSTLTVSLFTIWFSFDTIEAAQKLAGQILIAVFFCLTLERIQRSRRSMIHSRSVETSPCIRGKALTLYLCYIVCLIPITFGLIIPSFTLISWLKISMGNMDTQDWSELYAAVWTTIKLGLIVALITIALAIIIVGSARFSSRFGPQALLVQLLKVAGYASPGSVMAVSLLGTAALLRQHFSVDKLFGQLLLSSSIVWLYFGLVSRYFSVAAQMISQGLERLPKSYDHAALVLGDSPLKSFQRIILPLLRPEVLAGMTLVFVDICKELPLCLLLRPFGFETLATLAYSKVDQGTIYSCAAPSLLLVILAASSLLLVELAGWKKTYQAK